MSDEHFPYSDRLQFRRWRETDLDFLAAMNANPEVMRFFPGVQDRDKAQSFIERMNTMMDEKGYCYYAVELKESHELIGFIGIAYQTYEAPFNPSVDIGWRLDHAYWGKGYATEGAKACLKLAFETLGILQILSVAPEINTPSISVMKAIGMTHQYNFQHPALKEFKELETCAVYAIDG